MCCQRSHKIDNSTKIMKTNTTWLAGIAGFAFTLSSPAATVAVVVDWLKPPSGSLSSGFQLTDDNSIAVASGSLAVVSNQGASFPSLPLRTLNYSGWTGNTGFTDSLTGQADVSAMEFRVAPDMNGKANYTIQISVPAGRQLLLVVGDLFHDATASTAGVSIAALSDSGSVPVTLAGMYSWNNGATVLNQDLAWDQPSGALTTTAAADGNSKLAFLQISPISGLNPRLVLSVPQGYGFGTGDSVIIGIGTVIPEPGIFTLVGVCGILGLVLRRRV